MLETPLPIECNWNLSTLADVLEKVGRPGDFMTSGTWSGSLPRANVDGLGTLAFPLLYVQVAGIILGRRSTLHWPRCEIRP